jgi:hypothetical protein
MARTLHGKSKKLGLGLRIAFFRLSVTHHHRAVVRGVGAIFGHSSTQGALVIDKLDFLVRFWELRARHATLGEPLAAHEQVELLSLMQLVTPDAQLPEAGPVARSKHAIPAQVIGDGAIKAIELRYVSAAGLLVASAAPLAVGAQVVVRAIDAISGVDYALPCKVVWVYGGSPSTMALSVDGIPKRSVFGAVGEPHVAMNLGKAERLVG